MVRRHYHRSGPDSADPYVCVTDVFAFLMVILCARRSKARGLSVTTLLDTIAKDATWYFMVIFTSHLVLVMTLNLGRVSVFVSLRAAMNEIHCVSF